MNDVVNFLYTYLDDPAEIMSKARVNETIEEIERLTVERDAALVEAEEAKDEWDYLSQKYDNALVRMSQMEHNLKKCREFLRWFTPREDHVGYEARDLAIAIDKLVEPKND